MQSTSFKFIKGSRRKVRKWKLIKFAYKKISITNTMNLFSLKPFYSTMNIPWQTLLGRVE